MSNSAAAPNSTGAGSQSQAPTASTSNPAIQVRPVTIEDELDDDDDDEDDDLDDLLDEFNKAAISNAPQPSAAGTAPAATGAAPFDGADPEDDFARQLQAGMADLLGEFEDSPELQKQFETLVKELHEAAAAPPAPASASAGPSSSAAPAPNFSDTINRTMSRLQESGETITTEVADAESEDFLAEMLKQMGGIGDSEEDFSKMLLGMMEQLTNKDILYEPMRELADKYPEWLQNNESKLPAAEFQKYSEQFEYVKEICAKFEEASYSDASPTDREYIVEKMQKMQAAGSPPAELMGGMTDGLDIPSLGGESCPVQ